jgi:hypothetical protein
MLLIFVVVVVVVVVVIVVLLLSQTEYPFHLVSKLISKAGALKRPPTSF